MVEQTKNFQSIFFFCFFTDCTLTSSQGTGQDNLSFRWSQQFNLIGNAAIFITKPPKLIIYKPIKKMTVLICLINLIFNIGIVCHNLEHETLCLSPCVPFETGILCSCNISSVKPPSLNLKINFSWIRQSVA